MKTTKLTREEKSLERSLVKGDFADVDRVEFETIAKSLATRKRDAVLNIRINKKDLENIKRKARKYGVKYQTLISELIHRVAA